MNVWKSAIIFDRKIEIRRYIQQNKIIAHTDYSSLNHISKRIESSKIDLLAKPATLYDISRFLKDST